MQAIYKVGDMLKVNAKYLSEGRRYFGKSLKHTKLSGPVTKVIENTNDEKDGQGDIWKNRYVIKGVEICEDFLEPA